MHTPVPAVEVAGAAAAAVRHPRGLYTLFFTEMWERFSFYGMRALLVLFMVDATRTGGLGLNDEVATAIYGLYTAGVYLAALPGGWLADRLWGARQSVWYGGLIIAAGHFTLALPWTTSFYFGLLLLVLGTGLLKPNISAMVGQLYPEGGARRDAGFTLFYMGINLGATIGPFICGVLGEKLNWHLGFGAAGVGMVFGLIQYRLTARHLGQAGLPPQRPPAERQRATLWLQGAGAVLLAVTGLVWVGWLPLNPVWLARSTTTVISGVAILYFAGLLLFGGLDKVEKRRLGVIAVLFLSSAVFWSGFEQAGSSLNLFAARHTARMIGWAHFELPAGWFQSLEPLFIIMLAPVFASLWVVLARHGRDLSLASKFALGLFLLAVGFLIMVGAARGVQGGQKVGSTWLITTYLLHALGELCLSPVGLSSVTKLAPARLVGQMMGIWFLATSLGNLIAGLVAGRFHEGAVAEMPAQFLQIVWITAGVGLLLALLSKPIQRLASGVK